MCDSRLSWLSSLAPERPDRDRRLLERASEILEANILPPSDGEPLPWAPLRGICPSPMHYLGVWNWDSAFHAMTVGRWDRDLACEQVRLFLDQQLPSGQLPDVLYADGRVITEFTKPPVFPWACMKLDELRPAAGLKFLRYCHDRFKPYEAFWRRERGGEADGLFHYDSSVVEPDKRARYACLESGWDNSVRWDAGSSALWPIDLNCYMVMLYRAMEEMAHLLEMDDQNLWFDRAHDLAERINDVLWDDVSGAYCDVYRADGRSSGILSPASFMPLFVHVATPDRAARTAELASDPAKFFPGMPTVSYDHPNYSSSSYWRGPTWLNTAWFACKGLKNYGFDDTADAIRDTILRWCDANTDTIYEYYDSRSGKGLGAPQFGWSAAFIIEFILDW